MENLHVDINQLIHLEDTEDIEVLMNEEQLHFVDAARVSDTVDDQFHDLLVHICCG